MAINLTIDGRKLSVNEGSTLLDAAKRGGIRIPTLCYNEAIEPFGACRMCMVEISKPEWKGWKRLVTACLYPAEGNLIVETGSDAVTAVRRTVLDLLLARCPNSPVIQKLAAEHGVGQTSFEPDKDRDNCILCAQCVRICDRLGNAAITTFNRGAAKEVGTPFKTDSEDCVGCGACARICPTHNIFMKEAAGKRTIWKREFRLLMCEKCGRSHLTEDHAAWLAKRQELPIEYFKLCEDCHRLESSASMAAVVWPGTEAPK